MVDAGKVAGVRWWVAGGVGGLFVFLLAVRGAGPSDGFDNEQPKTISYTVDAVVHGRWVLPRDMFGRAATKPPLYNWLSMPVVGGLNQYTEWAFKLPSMIAMGLVVGLTAVSGGWLLGRRREAIDGADANVLGGLRPREIGLVCGAMLLASHTGAKFIYLARPDTLLLFFTTGGWLAATAGLMGERRRGWVNVCCWLCVGGAAMCKGLPALLIPIYIVIGSKVLVGRWSAMWRTGLAWGLPLAIGLVGAWLVAAYRVDPQAVVNELLGTEAAGKITKRGWWRIFTECYKAPGYMVVRFLPWSVVGLLMLLHIPASRWFGHAMGPAVLWVMVVVGFFAMAADKRGDYFAPAMPALAILAGYWLLIVGAKYRITVGRVLVGTWCVVVGLGVYHWKWSDAAGGMGEGVKAFAREVQARTAVADVIFIESGYHNLQAYLGVNQAGEPTREMIERARWVVMPVSRAGAGVEPVARSVAVSMWPGEGEEALGLYPIEGIDLGND